MPLQVRIHYEGKKPVPYDVADDHKLRRGIPSPIKDTLTFESRCLAAVRQHLQKPTNLTKVVMVTLHDEFGNQVHQLSEEKLAEVIEEATNRRRPGKRI